MVRARMTVGRPRWAVAAANAAWTLAGSCPPEPQLLQLAVGQVVHAVVHAGPEVVADVGARIDGVPLVLPVHRLAHAADELPVAVAGEQRVPVASPDDLDGVPPRPPERRLELLDDLPVPAHRPVEPLQVAVDDEDQVVELLARGQRDGPQRLGLVGLAVAHEHPHLGVGRRQQSPVFEVPLEPGLVDAHDRPEPHRHGGELPEVGHQPRVRVRRQARPPQLAPEALELPGGDAAFQVGAGVDPRRRVTLVVDEVGGLRLGGGPEEVVEPDLVEGRGRGVGRDVPADAVRLAVGAHHHRQRVPADEALQPLLEVAVAGIGGVLLGRDGVDVGRVRGERELHPRVLRPAGQLLQQPPGRGQAVVVDDRVERVEPVAYLLPVQIGKVPCRVGHEGVDDCARSGPRGRMSGPEDLGVVLRCRSAVAGPRECTS